MTKQITRWSPDTCRCVIEYAWDDSVDPSTRVHSLENVITICDAHVAVFGGRAIGRGASAAALFAGVVDENQRKNYVYEAVQVVNPALIEGRGFSYSFDKSSPRVLHVQLVGANAVQKTNITNRITANAQLSGKVVLDP